MSAITSRWLAPALSAVAAMVCIPAFAQSTAAVGTAQAASDTGGGQLGEIIVTAEKRSERIEDVPMSITAVTGTELVSHGVVDTTDLAKLVTGFSYKSSSYGQPILSIRGIGFDSRAYGNAPTVSVYLDQVPIPFSVLTRGAALDLERVEVLKGPQGTLFGENATGGAINYIAAKPPKGFEAGYDVSYGNFNDVDVSGFVGGALSDTLTARLAVRRVTADGWQYSMTRSGDTMGAKDFTQARLTLDFAATDKLRFEFSAGGWVDKSQMQAAQYAGYSPGPIAVNSANAYAYAAMSAAPLAPNNDRAADWDPGIDFRRHDTFELTSLRADYDVADNIQLTSITAYSHANLNEPQDADGTAFPDDFVQQNLGLLTSFSEELRLAGDSGPLRWMIGGNYEHQIADESIYFDQNALQNSGPFGPGGAPVEFTNTDVIVNQQPTTEAVFGSLDYSITPELTLQASTRYTSSKLKFNGCMRDDGPGQAAPGQTGASFAQAFTIVDSFFGSKSVIPPGGCVTLNLATLQQGTVYSHLDENNVAWRGGLDWKPDSDTILYANVTRGFKAGNYALVPAVFSYQEAPVKQEEVLAYEAGFKRAFAERKVELTGAVFYYDYTNKQLVGNGVFPIFGRLPLIINIPKSRVEGAEMGITAEPTGGLIIHGGITYIDSRVNQDPTYPDYSSGTIVNKTGTFDILGNPISIVGDAFPETPKWQGDTDAEYDFPLTPSLNGFVGATVTYQGSTYSIFGGQAHTALPDYTLGDLRAGLAKPDDKWRAQLWVRNVADKFYLIGADRVIDSYSRYTGFPRTFGLSLSYRF
jgi:iron complex outermembrane recepter protein